MGKDFKPKGYNSVSPYFIVNNPKAFRELMTKVFDAKELRKYEGPNGVLFHAEMQIVDSVIMYSQASEKFPANQLLIHVYVPDSEATYKRALAAGCESIEPPKVSEGDPDRRGSFKDPEGNFWSVGTQVNA